MIYQTQEQRQACKALITSAFSFSLMTVCVKQLNGDIPVAEMVLFRSLFSIVITRLMIKRLRIYPWGERKILLITRGILGSIALFCIFYALENLTLASATVLQYTYPTIAVLLAWVFLKEAISKRILVGVFVGLIGIILVIQPSWIGYEALIEIPFVPAIIAIAGATFTALAYISVRKLSASEHALVIVHYFPLVSIPLTIPFLLFDFVIPNNTQWILLLGIGVFTQLGQLCITKGLKVLPAGQACTCNYCQVFFASLWGVLIFNESLNSLLILGSFFILFSTLVSLSSKVEDLSDSSYKKSAI